MRRPTVMVVDDESLVRWSISETLAECGYVVTQAGDAQSALRTVAGAGNRPDVVLLDLWLPDSNDLSVLSAIHAMAPATRIILMTVHRNEDLFDEARRRGAFIAVDKPFDMSVLPTLIAAALASLHVH